MVSDYGLVIAAILRHNPESTIKDWSGTLVKLGEVEEYAQVVSEINYKKVPGGYLSDTINKYVGLMIFEGKAENKGGSKVIINQKGMSDLDSILEEGLKEMPEKTNSLINIITTL